MLNNYSSSFTDQSTSNLKRHMNSFHAMVLKDSETGDGPLNKYFTGTTKETVCLFLFIFFFFNC